MGGLHLASGHAASDATTTSKSGMEPSAGATTARSMGFAAFSNSPVDRMLVPLVRIDPRDDVAVMGSELDEMSLRSAKGGMAMSARPMWRLFEYISRSM